MLLHASHFDAGVISSTITVGGTVVCSTTQKRTGAYSSRVESSVTDFTNTATITLATPKDELYVQFAIYIVPGGGITGNCKLFAWKSAGGTILGGILLNNVSKKIEIYTGNYASLVATGSQSINDNTLYVFELYIKISDSGTITFRIDLTEDATFSGDTQPGADTTIGLLTLANLHTSSSSAYVYFDDIVVNDVTGTYNNSWPDGAKVYYMVPTGDGGTKQWTPSAGVDHYALVDEVPPSATDNLQATTVDKVDILTFPSLPGDAQSIKAVIPEVYAFKGSSTAPTRLALGIDINGEGVEYSADKDLALAQGLVSNLWESRPGGGYFSVADIADLSLYLKSAA